MRRQEPAKIAKSAIQDYADASSSQNVDYCNPDDDWVGELMRYFGNGKLGSLGPRDAGVEGICFIEFCSQIVS